LFLSKLALIFKAGSKDDWGIGYASLLGKREIIQAMYPYYLHISARIALS
jgi:hypothetical protein